MSSPPLHIVHTESSCGWGGQEIRVLTEAEGFLARGHHVELLTPPKAEIFAAARSRNIPVHALPIERKSLAGLAAMRSWLGARGRAADVLNSHSSTDSWLVALARTTLPGTPPLIRTRHVSSPVSPGRTTFWLYQRASAHVVTTGEALRQQLHRNNGFALESMTSVPTGIDLARFRPAEPRAARQALGLPQRPTLVIVATLRNWKGHSYLLEAFSRLRSVLPEWQLVIVGDGPQRQNLERMVGELGLASAVRLVGRRDDVPAWLNAAELFALPSYGEEGVPQAIMQAMACGLAVVSTPIGAIAEAVIDKTTGLLVPPRDASALAQALQQLMTDQALRERYAAAGLARAREHFGIELMLDRMEAVFRRFAPARQRAA